MPNIEIEFSRLSADGQELEQLTRDLCDALRYRAAWSGRGADDGNDLIVEEPTADDFGGIPRKWLVSCKDFADSGRSVSAEDVGNVPGRLEQHGCHGFLLVTTTQPSSGLIRAFEGWRAETRFLFHYWDAPRLKQMLLRDPGLTVAESYFGTSAGVDRLIISESEDAADGMIHYVSFADGRSFYFQTRKEPANPEGHLEDFEVGFDRLRSRLPGFASFAVRGVWYDDKHGSYDWRVDLAVQGFNPDLSALRERLSGVLAVPGAPGGQWHEFEFRLLRGGHIDQGTPKVDNPDELRLFSSWPDESPVGK